MLVKITRESDERYNKVFEVVEQHEKFVTIIDNGIKADYGRSEIESVCVTCVAIDKEGLINGMCIDCYDMYLDIGKTGLDIDKKKKSDLKALNKRREANNYQAS